jgi:hypothetical protein
MSNAKLKLTNNALIVHAGEDVVSLDVSTVANARVAIQTVIKAYEGMGNAVAEMKKSAGGSFDALAETFPITAAEPLLRDATDSLSPVVTKAVRQTVESAPYATQGNAIKGAVTVAANVYAEVADMLLAANGVDQIAISKSLMAKANGLRRTLDLLDESLDAPLNEAKRAKANQALQAAIYEKAVDAGKAIAATDFAGMDAEVIAVARRIVDAKRVSADKAQRHDSAVKSALRVSRS